MDKYEVIIYWSKEDNALIAETPELPGCIAHGETHSKALTNQIGNETLDKNSQRIWGSYPRAQRSQTCICIKTL